jgi:maltose/moltooligosaccharide transporter
MVKEQNFSIDFSTAASTSADSPASTGGIHVDAIPRLDAVDHSASNVSSLQIVNMVVGFFGIQFAWMLQMGQMGAILERLGADPGLTGLIAMAGPVTGVVVQPIVGALSDQCTARMGRRRPFLIAGTAFTALSLLLMPTASSLLMAAVLLWILDASLNLTQGPFRALIPDVLNKSQEARGYSLISLFISLGSILSALLAANVLQVHQWFGQTTGLTWLGETQLLFYLGVATLLVTMSWSVLSTREKPGMRLVGHTERPAGLDPLGAVGRFIASTLGSILEMPAQAKILCLAHSFTWFGLAWLFTFFAQFVPHNILHVANAQDPNYAVGVAKASGAYLVMNIASFVAAAVITSIAQRTSKKLIHTLGLVSLGGGLASMYFMHDITQLYVAMAFVGIGWASVLSMPYALLADHIPPGKEGVLMGTFNIFIAAPQVVTSLVAGAGFLALFNNDRGVAMVVGGLSMFVAAIILQFVKEAQVRHDTARSFAPAGH